MKRNIIKIIGLVMVILVVLGLIGKQMRTNKQVVSTYEKVLVDVVANKVFVKEFKGSEVPAFPVESPFSQGKNAYPAVMCESCNIIYALDAKPAPPGTQVDPEKYLPRCPKCGGPVLGEPKIPKSQKSMDVPGPVEIIKVPRE